MQPATLTQLEKIVSDAAPLFAERGRDRVVELALERKMGVREARCFAAFVRVLETIADAGAGDPRTWEALADAIVEVTEASSS